MINGGKMTMNERYQTYACKRLLASVVTLAISDACQPPRRTKTISGLTWVSSRSSLDAMRFLMGDGVKHYLELLDMDGDRFKEQLLKQMWDSTERGFFTDKISDKHRKNFRFNNHSFNRIPAAGLPINDDELDN